MTYLDDGSYLRASGTGKLVRGGKLHAAVYLGSGAPGVHVLACDERKVIPSDLVYDYRYSEFDRCRKKGCREWFQAGRDGAIPA